MSIQLDREPNDAPDSNGIRVWGDLLDFSERMVLAGLKLDLKPDEDLQDAFRTWYDEQLQSHEAKWANLAHRSFKTRPQAHG